MKEYYEFYCPVKLIAGSSALENIPFELELLGVERLMVVTDAGVREHGLLAIIMDVFAAAGRAITCIYDQVPSDSSLAVIDEVSRLYRAHHCQAILAVGGGSVMDTAKLANILVSTGSDDLMQFAGAHNLAQSLKPLLVIPTTAGTGSEVTMVAVVSDTVRQQKIAFVSYHLFPNAAIIDPRMTLTLPPKVTAMTAMDALTHAIEAYTGLAHNPISDAYAVAAIEKISQHLLPVLERPSDSEGRLHIAQAATMAGIAFSNSMVGLVHALGHALGAVAHLPHGMCMNVFLPYVLAYNLSTDQARIAQLLLPLTNHEVYVKTSPNQRAKAAIDTILQLRDEMYARTGLPRTLQECMTVSQDQFDEISQKAINDGAIIYNHAESDIDDIKQILQDAWDGQAWRDRLNKM
ncbi:iron-containing alcohol dehydrogenase [Moraxella sp. FZLJ2107]|uniref:iron-containing alcohol dehydrogenase n=1 Tax=unclassified Moraxella TaxID=2685852 RepID=UPI0020C8641B|nr:MULTISPECIES: iron-containing alcohol dehydrogenase [unclassified Moraxella]UTO05621.1 iron-containing alcohol dehydrogenase [Moraxella sp. FZLJ2107]UTO22357.1 iron-containing alcohol dehydrogenase [Moraxella sp. FZLJ2109]